jgi:serine/threonine protein kinase
MLSNSHLNSIQLEKYDQESSSNCFSIDLYKQRKLLSTNVYLYSLKPGIEQRPDLPSKIIVKRIDPRILKKDWYQESEVMELLNGTGCSWFPRFIEKIMIGDNFYMIYEYKYGCDLYEFIRQHEDIIPIKTVKYIYWQIISAIDKLHSMNIMHRDIKLENIVIDKNFNITIIDWTFAVDLNKMKYDKACGTIYYVSPELWANKPIVCKENDIWASGIILYALVIGYLPFGSVYYADHHVVMDIKKQVKGYKISYEDIPNDERKLLEKIFVAKDERLNSSAILRDEWFHSIDLIKSKIECDLNEKSEPTLIPMRNLKNETKSRTRSF